MNTSALKSLFTAGLMIAVSALSASAAPITINPSFDSFGFLDVDFGGNGIPNDSVAITTIDGVTLGLSAAQRYGSPVVTDDNAGNFFAAVGSYGAPVPAYGKWNFNFSITGLSGGKVVELYYDLDAGANSSVGTSLLITGNYEDSWNLGMGFLNTTSTFSPLNNGEYDFALVLRDSAGAELGRSAITVNVGSGAASVPDSSATIGLMGLAFAGLVAFRRRFGK